MCDKCKEMEAEIERLKKQNTRQERVLDKLREYVQAVGILSTLAPDMEIDPKRPLEMAHKIIAVVQSDSPAQEPCEWEQETDELGRTVTAELLSNGKKYCPECGRRLGSLSMLTNGKRDPLSYLSSAPRTVAEQRPENPSMKSKEEK